jgi:predicted  nucleic acid-binding Zn-ribbon protein
MSQISVLYRLQQVDSQLDVANTKLRNIEKVLLDDVSVSDARKIAIQTDEHHKSLLKILRESEAKSYDTRVKIELAEASLYGGKIQNPKELQELQNEIASLKRFLINLEDKQLEAMMQVEESEEKLMWANEGLLEAQKLQIERNAELNGEKTKLLSQIERLESERKATLPTISALDLGLYEQLRKNRNGVAVAKINSRSCTACGTTLTAALIQTTQSTGQLVRCPSCGRILYPG